MDKLIDGELVELTLNYLHSANREISRNSALMIKNYLKQVGINLELEAQEFSTLISNLRSGNYDLAAGWQSIQYIHWEPYNRFHSKGGSNYMRFSNQNVDDLIMEIGKTMDEESRNKLYHELQSLLYDEMPVVWFFSPINRIAVHKRFAAEKPSMRPGFRVNRFKLKVMQQEQI